jgi:hypothetical protein
MSCRMASNGDSEYPLPTMAGPACTTQSEPAGIKNKTQIRAAAAGTVWYYSSVGLNRASCGPCPEAVNSEV